MLYGETLSQTNKTRAGNAAQWYSAYLTCRRPWFPFPALKKNSIDGKNLIFSVAPPSLPCSLLLASQDYQIGVTCGSIF
jgi:hypothetical protein